MMNQNTIRPAFADKSEGGDAGEKAVLGDEESGKLWGGRGSIIIIIIVIIIRYHQLS